MWVKLNRMPLTFIMIQEIVKYWEMYYQMIEHLKIKENIVIQNLILM